MAKYSGRIGIICLIIMPILALADNSADKRTDGMVEKLHYEIATFGQTENKGRSEIEIVKTGGSEPLIKVTQILDINNQALIIRSEETYRAENLNLIDSKNSFNFSTDIQTNHGINSFEVVARPDGESLEIISSDTLAVSCRIPLTEDLVTGIGAMLLGRESIFEIGWSQRYRQINLINLTGQPYEIQETTDSVVSEETVALAAGSFDCFKVMKIMPDLIGYTYYRKEGNHIPVMIEAFDRSSMRRTMNIILTDYEER